MLNSFIEQLETEIEISSPTTLSKSLPSAAIESSKDVFLVHGRNEGIKEKVARFLEKLKLRVVILHEQPNAGKTIIEKLVDHSNVGFAVILLTADDQGGLINEPYEKQKPRARQIVILELGFFLGKLG
jgi:predicted nucleotide-binding protein